MTSIQEAQLTMQEDAAVVRNVARTLRSGSHVKPSTRETMANSLEAVAARLDAKEVTA